MLGKLRYKFKDDPARTEQLNRILWYSYPVVYLNAAVDQRIISKAIANRKQKKKRANAYLKDMACAYDALSFVTLTFDDPSLASTSEQTRKRYVQRWLNQNTRDYYANQDFGKKNGREHYHAVVAFNDKIEPWEYGFSKFRKVKDKDENQTSYKLSGYITKLANHAGKLGTGKCFHKKGMKDVDNLPF